MLRWLFLDMNSFFASVEQHDRPELRGRPVAVIPTETEHTCCIAASYDAKRRGVTVGTMVRDARKLCPGIAIVKARPDFYVDMHKRLMKITERHAPITKRYSIDEWAIRLVGREHAPDAALDIGRAIKDDFRRFGPCLTCSVGIAPTRLLAKIACELRKPDGLTVLDTADLPDALEHLDLTDLPGISRGMLARLHRHGVRTIRQLWDLSKPMARQAWGSVQGEHWWLGFHGIDAPEVKTHRSSMSHAHVLPPEFRSDRGAHGIMTRLLHKAAARLRYHGYFAHGLHASVRYEADHRWSDGIDLPACQDTRTVLQHFQRLWDRRPDVFSSGQAGAPKHVSIALTGLTADSQTTPILFPQATRDRRLAAAMDQLNRSFGTHTVYFAGMHHFRHPMDDKIAFGRVPDEAGARM